MAPWFAAAMLTRRATFGNACLTVGSVTGSPGPPHAFNLMPGLAPVSDGTTGWRGSRADRPRQARKLAKWTRSVLLSGYAESMIQVVPDNPARWRECTKTPERCHTFGMGSRHNW
jgi:hypothetical protein